MAIMNTVVNYKANHHLSILNKNYPTPEDRARHFSQIIDEIQKEGDTAANYVDIPLEEIIGENLDMHLEHTSLYVLTSFGLQSRSRFPNYTAIAEFLGSRFNYGKDDLVDQSPFQF